MSTSRHIARIVAMQTIFEWEFRGTDISEVFERNCDIHKSRLEDNSYALELVNGVMENYEELKAKIGQVAPEWPVEQISPVDRCTLYVAIFEILHDESENVPPVVAINEAIEIAKSFGGENSGKFVNGALGTVIRELPPEKQMSLKDQEQLDKAAEEDTPLSEEAVQDIVESEEEAN